MNEQSDMMLKSFSGWWLNQPIWKKYQSKRESSQNRGELGEHKKYLSCQHLVFIAKIHGSYWELLWLPRLKFETQPQKKDSDMAFKRGAHFRRILYNSIVYNSWWAFRHLNSRGMVFRRGQSEQQPLNLKPSKSLALEPPKPPSKKYIEQRANGRNTTVIGSHAV